MLKISRPVWQVSLHVLALTCLFSLNYLLDENMGSENEQDVLPIARQEADPTWVAGDWYLNQPSGYRLLFNHLVGTLADHWGFLATSIVGRFGCYLLVALGLVLISRTIGLAWQFSLFAIGLLLYLNPNQGMAAEEWFVGALESKAVAYGCVLLAIGLLLAGRYLWMALLLGLATSFHVAVGGWAFLTVSGWFVLHWQQHTKHWRQRGLALLIYLATSAFATIQVLDQVQTVLPASAIAPSFIYVYIRLPHHLNPQAWSTYWWRPLVVYLLVLLGVLRLLRWQSRRFFQAYEAQVTLAEFAIIALIPFLLGVAIAPIDQQGKFLQLYPFRLADVMLPLVTILLGTCALQQFLTGRTKQWVTGFCLACLTCACLLQAVTFQENLVALRKFPPLEPEFVELCTWIRHNTPPEAVFVSPPVEMSDFTWLAERSTIAKFKHLPQNRLAILEWYERMTDLSGATNPWESVRPTKNRKGKIARQLTRGYNSLRTRRSMALMQKYGASYFVSNSEQRLKLPIVYRNSQYILYGKQQASG